MPPVDRLVVHVHVRVLGEVTAQSSRDLLRGVLRWPRSRSTRSAQHRVGVDLRQTGAVGRPRTRSRAPAWPSTAPRRLRWLVDLAADRRGRPAQIGGDRTHRPVLLQPDLDVHPVLEGQPRPASACAGAGHRRPHRSGCRPCPGPTPAPPQPPTSPSPDCHRSHIACCRSSSVRCENIRLVRIINTHPINQGVAPTLRTRPVKLTGRARPNRPHHRSGSMRAMTDPLLITVAPTGAETAKEDCPSSRPPSRSWSPPPRSARRPAPR